MDTLKQETYVEFEVTEDDLKNGVPKDAYCCPVSRAIQRTLELEEGDVIVSIGVIRIQDETYIVEIGSDLYEYIERVDRGEVILPVRFVIATAANKRER